MQLRFWSVVLLVGSLFPGALLAQSVNISGFIRERGSREALPGVSVFISQSKIGITTNAYGYYSLNVGAPTDSVQISYRSVGYSLVVKTVGGRQSSVQDVALTPAVQQLDEVAVRGRTDGGTAEQMSTISVSVQQLQQTAALLGEKDVMKVLQLMPGVQKGNEGQTGLYVRGGGPDQNLLILDEAIVYNANHLFGFFSVFNTDALKNVELIKGGFPARYGGRLSSVVNMQMKEGARDRLHGEGGIGLISSKLTLEGPLTRNKKGSFLISARRTYADLLWKTLVSSDLPGIFFYDLNAKLNYDLGPKDRLFLSSYLGRDKATVDQKYGGGGTSNSGFNWGNLTATLRWNHVASSQLFVNTSAILSQYDFKVFQDESGLESPVRFYSQYASSIRDFAVKTDADWLLSNQTSLRFGAMLTAHRYTPSAVTVQNINLDTLNVQRTAIDALEAGLYAEATVQPAEQVRVNGGLRLSYFNVQGKTYLRPEPRLSVAYNLRNDWTVKASYAAMNQYTHLLSNSGLGLPTDLWVPSTAQLRPQTSQQVALGISRPFAAQRLILSVEGYYKAMTNIIGYREGASFLLVDLGAKPKEVAQSEWQQNVTTGRGWSYGTEFFLQRKTGRLNGWVGYTLSWTQHQFADLNEGKPFYARYDRRHDLSVVGIYQLKPRLSLSATFVFGTGNALTIPLGTATARSNAFFGPTTSITAPLYGERNGFRAAPYHRLDVALRFSKPKSWGERTWELGVYNAYNRINPFYYDTATRRSNGVSQQVLTRYGLFPIIPSLTYHIKF